MRCVSNSKTLGAAAYPEELLEDLHALLDGLVVSDAQAAALAVDLEHQLHVGGLAPEHVHDRVVLHPEIELGDDGGLQLRRAVRLESRCWEGARGGGEWASDQGARGYDTTWCLRTFALIENTDALANVGEEGREVLLLDEIEPELELGRPLAHVREQQLEHAHGLLLARLRTASRREDALLVGSCNDAQKTHETRRPSVRCLRCPRSDAMRRTTDGLRLERDVGVARLEWREVDRSSKQLDLTRLGNANGLEEHEQQLEAVDAHRHLVLATQHLLEDRSC